MKRPNFTPIIEKESDYCEVSSSEPVGTFVPNQAITLRELISRFERGQRLNVHMNFRAGDNFQPNLTDEEAKQIISSESMDSDDFPPTDVHDIADVHAHYVAHQAHKADFSARQKQKQAERQAKRKQAQQPAEPTPPEEGAE